MVTFKVPGTDRWERGTFEGIAWPFGPDAIRVNAPLVQPAVPVANHDGTYIVSMDNIRGKLVWSGGDDA